MASSAQNLSEFDAETIDDASPFSFGLVTAAWNQPITAKLKEGCLKTLLDLGASEGNIHELIVPGSFELVAGAQLIAQQHAVDAIICIGCIIKGETKHDEYISQAVANGLMDLTITYKKPFIFGVLTPNSMEQAHARAGGEHGNKGVEAAVTAVKMAALAGKKQ